MRKKRPWKRHFLQNFLKGCYFLQDGSEETREKKEKGKSN